MISLSSYVVERMKSLVIDARNARNPMLSANSSLCAGPGMMICCMVLPTRDRVRCRHPVATIPVQKERKGDLPRGLYPFYPPRSAVLYRSGASAILMRLSDPQRRLIEGASKASTKGLTVTLGPSRL